MSLQRPPPRKISPDLAKLATSQKRINFRVTEETFWAIEAAVVAARMTSKKQFLLEAARKAGAEISDVDLVPSASDD